MSCLNIYLTKRRGPHQPPIKVDDFQKYLGELFHQCQTGRKVQIDEVDRIQGESFILHQESMLEENFKGIKGVLGKLYRQILYYCEYHTKTEELLKSFEFEFATEEEAGPETEQINERLNSLKALLKDYPKGLKEKIPPTTQPTNVNSRRTSEAVTNRMPINLPELKPEYWESKVLKESAYELISKRLVLVQPELAPVPAQTSASPQVSIMGSRFSKSRKFVSHYDQEDEVELPGFGEIVDYFKLIEKNGGQLDCLIDIEPDQDTKTSLDKLRRTHRQRQEELQNLSPIQLIDYLEEDTDPDQEFRMRLEDLTQKNPYLEEGDLQLEIPFPNINYVSKVEHQYAGNLGLNNAPIEQDIDDERREELRKETNLNRLLERMKKTEAEEKDEEYEMQQEARIDAEVQAARREAEGQTAKFLRSESEKLQQVKEMLKQMHAVKINEERNEAVERKELEQLQVNERYEDEVMNIGEEYVWFDGLVGSLSEDCREALEWYNKRIEEKDRDIHKLTMVSEDQETTIRNRIEEITALKDKNSKLEDERLRLEREEISLNRQLKEIDEEIERGEMLCRISLRPEPEKDKSQESSNKPQKEPESKLPVSKHAREFRGLVETTVETFEKRLLEMKKNAEAKQIEATDKEAKLNESMKSLQSTIGTLNGRIFDEERDISEKTKEIEIQNLEIKSLKKANRIKEDKLSTAHNSNKDLTKKLKQSEAAIKENQFEILNLETVLEAVGSCIIRSKEKKSKQAEQIKQLEKDLKEETEKHVKLRVDMTDALTKQNNVHKEEIGRLTENNKKTMSDTKNSYDKTIEELKKEKDDAEKKNRDEMKKLKDDHIKQIQNLLNETRNKLQGDLEKAQATLENTKKQYEDQIKTIGIQHQEALQDKDAALKQLESIHQTNLIVLQKAKQQSEDNLRNDHKKKTEQAENQYIQEKNALNAQIATQKTENQNLKTQIDKLNTEIKDLKTQINTLKNDKVLLNAEIVGLKKDKDSLNAEISKLKTDILNLKNQHQEEISRMQKENKTAQEEQQQKHTNEMKKQKQEHDTKTNEQNKIIEDWKAKHIDVSKKHSDLEEKLKQTIADRDLQFTEWKQTKEQLNNKIKQLEAAVEQYKKEIADLKKQLLGLKLKHLEVIQKNMLRLHLSRNLLSFKYLVTDHICGNNLLEMEKYLIAYENDNQTLRKDIEAVKSENEYLKKKLNAQDDSQNNPFLYISETFEPDGSK